MTSTNPKEGIYPSSRAERALLVAAIAIASIGLGYLFFTQLWWKVRRTSSLACCAPGSARRSATPTSRTRSFRQTSCRRVPAQRSASR